MRGERLKSCFFPRHDTATTRERRDPSRRPTQHPYGHTHLTVMPLLALICSSIHTQVSRIQQEHDRKELTLKADHSEELKHAVLEAENELREKTVLLRNEHEAQMRALRCEHEDECRKLQEELDLQKSKEHSISSSKMRNSGGNKRNQHALGRPEGEEKESPLSGATQTPVSKLLKKIKNVNTGSVMSIPKHHKKGSFLRPEQNKLELPQTTK